MHRAAARLRTGWHSALCQGCEGWQRSVWQRDDLKEALSGRATPTLQGTSDHQTVSAASAGRECGSLLWPSLQHPTALARHIHTHLFVHSFIPALIHPRLHPPVDLVLFLLVCQLFVEHLYRYSARHQEGSCQKKKVRNFPSFNSVVKSVLSI